MCVERLSKVVWSQSRSPCYSGKHFGSDLVAVVKGKDKVRPARPGKDAVWCARLPLHNPADAKQCGKHSPTFAGRPLTHAGTANNSFSSGMASPWSIRSAMMRRARASAFATASSRVVPYAMTPEISGTSAIHRPSSSLSTSILMLSFILAIQKGRILLWIKYSHIFNMCQEIPVGRVGLW